MTVDVRCSQLMHTYAPGAIHVDTKGISRLVAGLDQWYKEQQDAVSPQEFLINHDIRLLKRLGLPRLKSPPVFRTPRYGAQADPKVNYYLTIPALLFPRSFVCSSCRHLSTPYNACGVRAKGSASARQKWNCQEDGCRGRLRPVRFIVFCKNGHLGDVPWRRLCCGDAHCSGKLQLKDGGGGLDSVRVTCDLKPESHTFTLGGFTDRGMENEDSGLAKIGTRRLGAALPCNGHRPWLGSGGIEQCECQPIGTLINAVAVHYPRTMTSVTVPLQAGSGKEELSLRDKIRSVPTLMSNLALFSSDDLLDDVRSNRKLKNVIKDIDDKTIIKVLDDLQAGKPAIEVDTADSDGLDADEMVYRRGEISFFRRGWGTEDGGNDSDLIVKKEDPPGDLGKLISSLSRVTRLNLTTVYLGFDRVTPEPIGDNPQAAVKRALSQLFLDVPHNANSRWLPAVESWGEGIFVELDNKEVANWIDLMIKKIDSGEALPIKRWINRIHRHYAGFDNRLRGIEHPPGEFSQEWILRYGLVHSLSHALMNECIFSCGYGSAAIAERLYVSDIEQSPMSGILIRTTGSDSEGSMGGLVRMGRPDQFGRLLFQTLDRARWCSGDPVCMEAPGMEADERRINRSACHACILVPETACETGNRLLDRALLVGLPDVPEIGFFNSIMDRV